MHMPRNIWQVAKVLIAHIHNRRRWHWWLLKPAWGRQGGCCSSPCKLPQCSGSSVVPIVLFFEDRCYGLQLSCPVVRHVDGLDCVGPPLHSVTPGLRQNDQGWLLQPFVPHVGFDATKDVLRVLEATWDPATLDLLQLMGRQIAPLLECKGVRGFEAIPVAPATVECKHLGLQPLSIVADAPKTSDHKDLIFLSNLWCQAFLHNPLELIRCLPAMSSNNKLTNHRKELVDIFMGMAHHEEVESHSGELLHANHLAAECSSIRVLGLGDCVVRLQDQVDREPSTLDLAKLGHLVQQLAYNLHIGVAAVTQGFLSNEDAGAPPVCHPTCDCHPRPRLQGLNLMGFSVKVVLGPDCLLAVHGVDDHHQDSRIETPRHKAKAPIQDATHVLVSQMVAPQPCIVQLIMQRSPWIVRVFT